VCVYVCVGGAHIGHLRKINLTTTTQKRKRKRKKKTSNMREGVIKRGHCHEGSYKTQTTFYLTSIIEYLWPTFKKTNSMVDYKKKKKKKVIRVV
jgi:hypothetical protein